MCNEKSQRFGRRFSKAAALTLALGAASGSFGSAFAQQSTLGSQELPPRADARRISELEQVFWACDYTATARGVQAAPVALCAAVTEELKNFRFGGDFTQMLEWWRQHKPSAHQQLARKARSSAVEPVANR